MTVEVELTRATFNLTSMENEVKMLEDLETFFQIENAGISINNTHFSDWKVLKTIVVNNVKPKSKSEKSKVKKSKNVDEQTKGWVGVIRNLDK